jgi:pantothenate synthetase
MIDNGSIQVDDIIDKMRDIMIDIDIEYIYILKRDFSKIDKIIKDDTIILVACRFDKTRLIDNIWV